jgi:hypothetical protein
MEMEGFIIAGFLLWLVFVVFGGWVAAQKGRSVWEGAILAGLFGPFGVLIEALLPVPAPGPSPPPPTPEQDAAQAEAAEWRRRAQAQAYQDLVAQRERERLAWVERGRALRAWLRSAFSGRWIGALPDWVQPIVWGLLFSAPIALVIGLFSLWHRSR